MDGTTKPDTDPPSARPGGASKPNGSSAMPFSRATRDRCIEFVLYAAPLVERIDECRTSESGVRSTRPRQRTAGGNFHGHITVARTTSRRTRCARPTIGTTRHADLDQQARRLVRQGPVDHAIGDERFVPGIRISLLSKSVTVVARAWILETVPVTSPTVTMSPIRPGARPASSSPPRDCRIFLQAETDPHRKGCDQPPHVIPAQPERRRCNNDTANDDDVA